MLKRTYCQMFDNYGYKWAGSCCVDRSTYGQLNSRSPNPNRPLVKWTEQVSSFSPQATRSILFQGCEKAHSLHMHRYHIEVRTVEMGVKRALLREDRLWWSLDALKSITPANRMNSARCLLSRLGYDVFKCSWNCEGPRSFIIKKEYAWVPTYT